MTLKPQILIGSLLAFLTISTTVVAPTMAHVPKGPNASDIISLARKFVGGRYVWGGSSPNSGGFDCSGLVQYVFAKNGIHLPRVAEDQYKVGTPVSYHQLQPGDLIFQAGTYKAGISHVGIYIGEGKVLHAKGKDYGIVIDSISPSYAKRARRVLRNGGEGYTFTVPTITPKPGSVGFVDLPTAAVRGTIELIVNHDPIPHTKDTEYAIEVDGVEVICLTSAGKVMQFDSSQLPDGVHDIRLVRRNKKTKERFVAQTASLTTENFR